MRAIAVDGFGAVPKLIDVPQPQPAPGELLVRIEAAGVNPIDARIADGFLDGQLPHQFPLVLGVDGAGAVTAVGQGVTRFALGDRVVGRFLAPPIGRGTFAEYAVIPEQSAVTPIPDRLSTTEAATLPAAGMTALELIDATGPHTGRTVLVVGATGGVGSFLMQLAAARGAHVIATARNADAARPRALGAAETIDHTEAPVAGQVRSAHPDGIHTLIDLVSNPEQFAELLRVLRRGGTAWSSIGSADDKRLTELGLAGGNFESQGDAETLARVVDEAAEGRIRVPVEREVTLDQLPAILTDLTHLRGKTVLRIG
ncbi:NADP-dependent oxidoreductase [Streptomyces sp. NPDC000880]